MVLRLMASLGAAVVVVAMAGCSGNSGNSSSPSPAGTSSSAASGTAGPQQNKVLVDGQDQGAVEHVRCSTMTDGMRMKISMGDHGVVVILNAATPPGVKGVQFSKTVLNGGVTLEYDSRKNEGSAQVAVQGNGYKITGTGIGKDSSNQQVSKPFEIDVTCP